MSFEKFSPSGREESVGLILVECCAAPDWVFPLTSPPRLLDPPFFCLNSPPLPPPLYTAATQAILATN